MVPLVALVLVIVLAMWLDRKLYRAHLDAWSRRFLILALCQLAVKAPPLAPRWMFWRRV